MKYTARYASNFHLTPTNHLTLEAGYWCLSVLAALLQVKTLWSIFKTSSGKDLQITRHTAVVD